MYNYGYRDYKPQAARFTTVDPIRDGTNWFVYVNNDPVNWIDLFGLSASDGTNTTGTISEPTVQLPTGPRVVEGEVDGNEYYVHIHYRTDVEKVDTGVIAYPSDVTIETTIITVTTNGEIKTTVLTPAPVRDDAPDGVHTMPTIDYGIPDGETFVGGYTDYTITGVSGTEETGEVVYDNR